MISTTAEQHHRPAASAAAAQLVPRVPAPTDSCPAPYPQHLSAIHSRAGGSATAPHTWGKGHSIKQIQRAARTRAGGARPGGGGCARRPLVTRAVSWRCFHTVWGPDVQVDVQMWPKQRRETRLESRAAGGGGAHARARREDDLCAGVLLQAVAATRAHGRVAVVVRPRHAHDGIRAEVHVAALRQDERVRDGPVPGGDEVELAREGEHLDEGAREVRDEAEVVHRGRRLPAVEDLQQADGSHDANARRSTESDCAGSWSDPLDTKAHQPHRLGRCGAARTNLALAPGQA